MYAFCGFKVGPDRGHGLSGNTKFVVSMGVRTLEQVFLLRELATAWWLMRTLRLRVALVLRFDRPTLFAYCLDIFAYADYTSFTFRSYGLFVPWNVSVC